MTLLLWSTWFALALACAAALACGLAVRFKPARPWARRAVASAAAGVLVPLGVLVLGFLRADVSIFYVWEHVDAAYPWWLRMAGVWGGQAGTFLLWTTVVLLATAIEDRRGPASPAWRRARAVLCLVGLVLLVPTVVLGLGEPSSLFGLSPEGTFQAGSAGPGPLSLRPDGAGLNPLLESPYMAIHPVVEFLAYGVSAVPFAYGLVHLARGGGGAMQRAERWARPAWLAFLVALTLGALWAYNVLSFGGYWIWDPVEVANLLPFLALTLFLHARPVQKSGHLGLLAPAAAVLPFALIVSGDFVVRSGLWASVHAFLPTGVSIAIDDPMRRLLVSVRQSFQARYATSMAAATLGVTAAGVSTFHARRLQRGSLKRDLARAAVAGYGLVALAGLIVPGPTVALLHRAALVLGVGNPIAGVLALVALFAAPLAAGLLSEASDPPVTLRTRRGQLVLACALFVLSIAATVVLLVLGVNGYSREVFDARAPFLAGPFLALVALAFTNRGTRRWTLAVVAALATGALLKLATGSWALAAVPVAAAPIASAAWLYVQRARPTRSRREHVQALLLLAAGVLGLVQWTSPGSVTLGSVSLASPPAYAPVGLAASTVVLAWPYLEKRRRVPAGVGPVVGLLAVGYGVGGLLALAALALGPHRVRGPRGALASGAIPLIHVGLALLVLGTAASTYATTTRAFDQADPLVRGEPAEAGPYAIELVNGSVQDTDGNGRPDRVLATVHVTEDGTFVSEETLVLSHSTRTGFTGRGSFVPEASPVTRAWWGDLAHNADTTTPLAIRLSGGNGTWITANGPPPRSFEGQVDAVSMGVKQLPAVNVLWAGAGIMAIGMAARIARD